MKNVGLNLDSVPVVDYDGLDFTLPNQPMRQMIA